MANEKRLIDANALTQEIETLRERHRGKCTGTIYGGYTSALCAIAGVKTVDAVEVVHGQWIVNHNPITDPKGYFIRIICSKCDLKTGQKSNYCPNCGAKMDGKGDD